MTSQDFMRQVTKNIILEAPNLGVGVWHRLQKGQGAVITFFYFFFHLLYLVLWTPTCLGSILTLLHTYSVHIDLYLTFQFFGNNFQHIFITSQHSFFPTTRGSNRNKLSTTWTIGSDRHVRKNQISENNSFGVQ